MTAPYPLGRPRRLRASVGLRRLTQETTLSPADFIAPLFVEEGTATRTPIASLPGHSRLTLDLLVDECRELYSLGIGAVLLFAKVPDALKDNTGAEALNPGGLYPRAIKAIKAAVPELVVMTDIALDPFSSYGHDGIVEGERIVNDATVDVLAQMAVVHAQAGADVVAPSDMMDGRIGAIRRALEAGGYPEVGILAYTAKYASCLYGPFRDALDSAPGFGDKQTYQMQPGNAREALREAALDEAEGADILMVKPGLWYLDVLYRLRQATPLPLAVYQVSGEYAQLHATADRGWLHLENAMWESLLALKRAGADLIATYFAKAAAQGLQR
ncbi:MAG: porphobilinogen synthase [Bacteroidia bacterium]|nr:porphobilinogen synthase [Bacteroidia bacterium]